MFWQIRYENDINQQFYFNLDPDPAGYTPVQNIKFGPPDVRGDDIDRMQDQGVWPGYTYYGAMPILLEGTVIAIDPETTNQYALEMLNILMPFDPGFQINKHVGNFYVGLVGLDRLLYVEVGKVEVDLDRSFPATTVIPFHVTFRGFRPYFKDVDTQEKRWIA